jgi:glycerophosphoryl diester phosphodiesterase
VLRAFLKPNTNNHLIVSGKAPTIVAKGGFSGLFPDSSVLAYQFVEMASSPDTAISCDVWLTKDGTGICLPNINMDNCTTISDQFPQGKKTYNVNGVSTAGWFSVDFTSTDLQNVSCKYKSQTCTLLMSWAFRSSEV